MLAIMNAVIGDPTRSATHYFTQDFYHMWMPPLAALTVALAWMARPSTSEEIPREFSQFKYRYLTVWAVCVAADWLQGPYVYALYASYGFSSSEIAQLFVAGFASSLIFGCFVGSVTDNFGRKKTCLLYCVFYILSCMTKHVNQYSILMLGRVTGGIATSMLFSSFECWMVAEHLKRNRFSPNLLGYMFGLMFTVMYCVAIASGLAGQFVADSFTFEPISKDSTIYVGGVCCPFDLAIVCLCVGMVMIALLWDENYGAGDAAGSSMIDNFQLAFRLLLEDTRMLLVCAIVACFEGSMFAFVFNWTPALDSKEIPPPFGVIFAMFMMACMCGASASTLVGSFAKPSAMLLSAFLLGIFAFAIASAVPGHSNASLMVSFAAFLVFEFCVGLYFPSIGIVKSEIVPEEVRGTMYNIYRIPLNGIVVGLLLTNISIGYCFKLCAVLLFFSLASMGLIVSKGDVASVQAPDVFETKPMAPSKTV